MKELEAIRDLVRKLKALSWDSDGNDVIPLCNNPDVDECADELEALLPALVQQIEEHERLAVAAARRDAIEKCRIALRANFLGPQAEELCGMFTRWMRDDAQTLDAHDADTRNRALEEAADCSASVENALPPTVPR